MQTLLKDFCDSKHQFEYLRKPWIKDGKIYATDSVIAAIIPTDEPDTDNGEIYPDIEMIKPADSLEGSVDIWLDADYLLKVVKLMKARKVKGNHISNFVKLTVNPSCHIPVKLYQESSNTTALIMPINK